MNYNEVVNYLENLGIMPKTAPGLDKISKAIEKKKWFAFLKPEKIITIAGTNGKGTTAAVLEALLLDAGQKVGLYTSPHLVKTTERIRLNGINITEDKFIELFLKNKDLIDECQLSHFESLTLMAADLFFSEDLDFIIFEVGLGGTFDATNVFPNKYSVITKIGLDHENILGRDLLSIAKNKFGIIKPNNIVIHHALPPEVFELKGNIQRSTKSIWFEASPLVPKFNTGSKKWSGDSKVQNFETNMIGPRAIENMATSIEVFQKLGFNIKNHFEALKKINWPGRMQKISWPEISADIYLSGDHNLQGIESLLEILKFYDYKTIHVIVGIGAEKSYEKMLEKLIQIPRSKLYITETPFKGLSVDKYPDQIIKVAQLKNKNVEEILSSLKKIESDDLIIVTGSLYLVGYVLMKQSKSI